MSRIIRTAVLLLLGLIPLTVIFAQPPPPPPPITTETPLQPAPPTSEGPPIETGMTSAPPGQGFPQATPFQPGIAPTSAAPPTAVPQVTPEATPDATEEDLVEITDAVALLIAIRPDLELLANVLLGEGTRPETWSGTSDISNPQLALLARLDLEILAGTVLGETVRPRGWFGAVSTTPYAQARDIRHDLELLADVSAQDRTRPTGWLGAEPLFRCSRATQTLVGLLEASGVFQLTADPTSPEFCEAAELEASQFAEINLLSNPSFNGSLSTVAGAAVGTATVNTEFAAAFLDRGASLRVGVIPNGTEITPVARSYAQFSNMMLVRGENFELFVDYQFTSVSTSAFEALPDVDEGTYDPFCGADWCEAG